MSGTADHIAAELAIQQLCARYCYFMDTGQFDEFEQLWAADAVFDIIPDPKIIDVPVRGPRAIRAQVETRHHETSRIARHRHSVSNLVIWHEAPGAARAVCLLTTIELLHSGGGPVVRSTGEYRDRFALRDGVWKFTERVLALDALGAWRPGQGGSPDAGT